MVSVNFNPIGSWLIVAAFALVVTVLTLWAYSARMRGGSGRWRWIAVGLRLMAVLLCVLAALRPSVVFQEKKKQPTSLVFLTDASSSMTITDMVGGQERWTVARAAVDQARAAASKLGENVTPKFYQFDSKLRDDPEKDAPEPDGHETAMGQALLDALRRESGMRVASIVLLGDGNNNTGISPLIVAKEFKAQQVPIVTVGFGTDTAGEDSKDIAVHDLIASPTVFVKNQLQVRGVLKVRGFAGQTLDVEMLVEDQDQPVASRQIKVPQGVETIPISGLSHAFKSPGEKRVTLRVKPKKGELIQTNNEISTFVTVLKGGLSVLFVQGPHSPWEQKFWLRAVRTSPDIQGDLKWLHLPVSRDTGKGELPDELFTYPRYDVYVLSDLPANFLTPTQQALLTRAVQKGAGLIMLGGRSSFGAGGWERTDLAEVLPVIMRPSDGQIEPEGGVRFQPNTRGLDNYLLQIAPNKTESQRIWRALPPLPGVNHLGEPKKNALIFGQTEGGRAEPVMIGMDGPGRVLAFGGETWVWARTLDDEGPLAYRRFWRQVIFWLAHKEDKGENEVKLSLDARRLSIGEKLGFGITARDEKGVALTGVTFKVKAEREGGEPKFSEPLDSFSKGEESRGTFYAKDAPPGDYRISVEATRDGKEIGRDSARFIVYQDDRELENPAADNQLMKQIAEASGGEALTPDQLPKYLDSLKGKAFSESLSQTEKKIWDNWPFLLLFTAILMLEWWLRKRHGWV